MAVLSETVVVGGQLEQLDLSDHLELLQVGGKEERTLLHHSQLIEKMGKKLPFMKLLLEKRDASQSLQGNKYVITFLLFSKLIRPPCKGRKQDC